jgi:hypothetical protein
MPRGNRRVLNRRRAIDHIVEAIGSDVFTTAEVWATGQRMLKTGQMWPRYTKAAFKGLRDGAHVANVLTRHPGYERADEGGQRYVDATRTALWIARR